MLFVDLFANDPLCIKWDVKPYLLTRCVIELYFMSQVLIFLHMLTFSIEKVTTFLHTTFESELTESWFFWKNHKSI